MHAPAPAFLAATAITRALAWLLLLAGSAVMTAALFSLRARAALPSTRDTLAETGLYARVRHPLYAGMLLVFGGLALYRPTLPAGLACALGVLWIYIQARLEEHDLLQRLPAYAGYMRRVPRFWPWPGRIHS
jgi:protein-S-isoprenylcysteine O-methyltransferase Ste14